MSGSSEFDVPVDSQIQSGPEPGGQEQPAREPSAREVMMEKIIANRERQFEQELAQGETMEQEARDYFDRIEQQGGMIPAIEAGYPQTEIAGASYRYQREIETGERVIVGVNRFQSDDQPIELLEIDETSGEHQSAKLAALRQRRVGDYGYDLTDCGKYQRR